MARAAVEEITGDHVLRFKLVDTDTHKVVSTWVYVSPEGIDIAADIFVDGVWDFLVERNVEGVWVKDPPIR